MRIYRQPKQGHIHTLILAQPPKKKRRVMEEAPWKQCLDCVLDGLPWCGNSLCNLSCPPVCPCEDFCTTNRAECFSVPGTKYCVASQKCLNMTIDSVRCEGKWVYKDDNDAPGTHGPLLGAAIGIGCIVIILIVLVWHLRKIPDKKKGKPDLRIQPNSSLSQTSDAESRRVSDYKTISRVVSQDNLASPNIQRAERTPILSAMCMVCYGHPQVKAFHPSCPLSLCESCGKRAMECPVCGQQTL